MALLQLALKQQAKYRPGKLDSLAGFETVAGPASVKSDSSSASLSLARLLDSMVVSTQPDPRSSPVRTLRASKQLELLLKAGLLLLAPSDESIRGRHGVGFPLDHVAYVMIM